MASPESPKLLPQRASSDSLEVENACTHPLDDGEPVGSASSLVVTANLITMSLGAGILSLPWVAAGASMVTGAVMAAVVLLIIGWTCMILVEAAEKYKLYDMGAILGQLPGRRLGPGMMIFVNVSVWVTMFLAVVSYLIILADSLLPVIKGGPLGRKGLLVIGSVVMLPLCYVDQKYLSISSTLTIIANVYLLGLVVYLYFGPSENSHLVCNIGFSKGSVSMFSNLMMAMMIQPCVLPTYVSLERRSVARFRWLLLIAFVFVFLLFAAFQTFAVYTFGPGVPSDVLNALPHDAAGSLARISLLLVVVGVCPLIVAPMVAPIRTAKSGGKAKANLATLGIVLASMVVSFFTHKLGLINVLNGAVGIIGLCTIAPAMVGLYLVDRSPFCMIFLVVLGIVTTVLAFIFMDNYVDDLHKHCIV